MSKVIIEEPFWDLFPEAQIAIVLAKNIDNHGASSREIVRGLEAANDAAGKWVEEGIFSENPVIAVWRAAYQKFKTKKGARSSIENLLKRIDKGKAVGSINPLVDIYNTISLTYGFPAGGEDSDSFVGDMRLTKTVGGDAFRALGDDEDAPTLSGEICYLDDAGAVCRCWNWRDGTRTMLTDHTTNAFLIIESCDPTRTKELLEAMNALSALTEQYLGATTSCQLMDKEHRELTLKE